MILHLQIDVARKAFERHLLKLNRRLWRSKCVVVSSVVELFLLIFGQSLKLVVVYFDVIFIFQLVIFWFGPAINQRQRNVLKTTGVIKFKPLRLCLIPEYLFSGSSVRSFLIFPFFHVVSNARADSRMPQEQRGLWENYIIWTKKDPPRLLNFICI